MSWEAWGDPPDDVDPLEGVHHPRERKPWKRDREAVLTAMRQAINLRRSLLPLAFYPNSRESYGYRDHIERMICLAHVAHIRRECWWEKQRGRQMRSVQLENLARAHRYLEGASFRAKVPLP